MGKKVCAFADSERHLGHILKVASEWLACDATHLDKSGTGFRVIGLFPDIDSAKIAVEEALMRTPARTRVADWAM
jgi:hypothetical protein